MSDSIFFIIVKIFFCFKSSFNLYFNSYPSYSFTKVVLSFVSNCVSVSLIFFFNKVTDFNHATYFNFACEQSVFFLFLKALCITAFSAKYFNLS